MLTRARLRSIFEIALPIILALFSQSFLNLVDTRMVRHLGDAALSAVGIASFANFVASAPIMGLSAGVQAMAARRIGEGRVDEAAHPLNGGLTAECLTSGCCRPAIAWRRRWCSA
jgi:Na+-driven multidrug efflux pump